VPPGITFPHITSSEDLVTSYEATRAGFVALALERSARMLSAIDRYSIGSPLRTLPCGDESLGNDHTDAAGTAALRP